MFADRYLLKNQNEALIEKSPDPATGIIVVIPCLKEPDILRTLQSLEQCDLPGCLAEVIVLLNHSENANEEIKEFNKNTFSEIKSWNENLAGSRIRYFAVGPLELRKKWAGAGLARKRGMDEALRRFNLLGKKDGIIVSLDADTLVEPNYLTEIEKYFQQNPGNVGATIAFKHRKNDLDPRQLQGIEMYEEYLQYYKAALQFTGYPHAMFTVGSAFAVKADAYVKRGGMNRRQAGEDFYFLQNLVQIGEVGEIAQTTVHPSARLSDRVPFGTGPILARWMKGEEDLSKTYDLRLFTDLKLFFDTRQELFGMDEDEFKRRISLLPESVSRFLAEDNFWEELDDLNKNCSTAEAFQNRFFQKFNAFKILKYLNFATGHFYPKADLKEQVVLLKEMGITF